MRFVRESDHPLPEQGRGGRGRERQPRRRIGDRPVRSHPRRRERARGGRRGGRLRGAHGAPDLGPRAGRRRRALRSARRARRGGPASPGVDPPPADRGNTPDLADPWRSGPDDRGAVAAGDPGGSPVPVGPRDAGPVLGRLAVLRRDVEGAPPWRHRHEHAHRRRNVRGLPVQRGGHRVPELLPRRGARHGRRGAAPLLRHGRGHRHADPARSLPRGPGQEPYVGCDPTADRPRAAHRARRPRWGRTRPPDRAGRRRRPGPGAARGEDRGRRPGGRGLFGRRREHGHR